MDYTDLSWCNGVEDRKSTATYVFMLGGASVAWNSRKEPVLELSSCEEEYIYAFLCACQVTRMVNLVEEITTNNHVAITMKIDNMYAINLVKNSIAHGRSIHIEMKFHYLRDQVENGKLDLEHFRIENQIVNIMMKGVQVEVFKKLRSMINVDSLDTINYVVC